MAKPRPSPSRHVHFSFACVWCNVGYAGVTGITNRLRGMVHGAHRVYCSAPRAVIPMSVWELVVRAPGV